MCVHHMCVFVYVRVYVEIDIVPLDNTEVHLQLQSYAVAPTSGVSM